MGSRLCTGTSSQQPSLRVRWQAGGREQRDKDPGVTSVWRASTTRHRARALCPVADGHRAHEPTSVGQGEDRGGTQRRGSSTAQHRACAPGPSADGHLARAVTYWSSRVGAVSGCTDEICRLCGTMLVHRASQSTAVDGRCCTLAIVGSAGGARIMGVHWTRFVDYAARCSYTVPRSRRASLRVW